MAEAVAVNKKSLGAILKEITKLTGPVITSRKNYRLSQEKMDQFKKTLQDKAPEKFAGMKIQKVVTIDGYKFIIDNDTWIGLRLSGTEPIVRLYAESATNDKLKKLVSAGEKFINGK